MGNKVNKHINRIMDTNLDYIIDGKLERFSNGEGKSVLEESVIWMQVKQTELLDSFQNQQVKRKFG